MRIPFTLAISATPILEGDAIPLFDRDGGECCLAALTIDSPNCLVDWTVRVGRLLPAADRCAIQDGDCLVVSVLGRATWPLRSHRGADGVRSVELESDGQWLDLDGIVLRDLLTDEQFDNLESLAS